MKTFKLANLHNPSSSDLQHLQFDNDDYFNFDGTEITFQMVYNSSDTRPDDILKGRFNRAGFIPLNSTNSITDAYVSWFDYNSNHIVQVSSVMDEGEIE